MRVATIGEWRPYAVAELNGRLEGGSLSIRASNTVSLAYGLGEERMMTAVNAGWNQRLSQRVSLNVGGGYNWSRNLIFESSQFETATANASLRIEMARRLHLRIGGNYSYRRVLDEDIEDIQSGRFGVAFEYRAGAR